MRPLPPTDAIAVHVTRGPAVESIHRVHVAVADATGLLHAHFGNPHFPTFLRSVAKPFQLAPLLLTGGADRFGFTDEEIAIMAASHNGERRHVETVQGILAKIGLGPEHLRCGAHSPYHKPTADAIGAAHTALHNNCSGKHAGMLALALHLGQDPATYLDPNGKVQQAILDVVSRASGVPREQIALGTDGCSAPTFGLPLAAQARAFALLARPWRADKPYAQAFERIQQAMVRNPWFVAGSDRLDTRLMDACEGRLLTKAGGEAVQAVADLDSGLALMLKVEDGSSRAVAPATIEAVRQLGWMEGRALEVLGDLWRADITNHAGLVVGRVEPVLELVRAAEPVSR